jgi:hypothetical protein
MINWVNLSIQTKCEEGATGQVLYIIEGGTIRLTTFVICLVEAIQLINTAF